MPTVRPSLQPRDKTPSRDPSRDASRELALSSEARPEVQLLDDLAEALDRVRAASRDPFFMARDGAIRDAFEILGALYAALDPTTSPEAAAHAAQAYDECARALGSTATTKDEELLAASVVIRAIKSALLPEDRAAAHRAA